MLRHVLQFVITSDLLKQISTSIDSYKFLCAVDKSASLALGTVPIFMEHFENVFLGMEAMKFKAKSKSMEFSRHKETQLNSLDLKISLACPCNLTKRTFQYSGNR